MVQVEQGEGEIDRQRYISMHVHMQEHIHRHIDPHTHTQRHSQTSRNTHRYIDKHMHTHTRKQMHVHTQTCPHPHIIWENGSVVIALIGPFPSQAGRSQKQCSCFLCSFTGISLLNTFKDKSHKKHSDNMISVKSPEANYSYKLPTLAFICQQSLSHGPGISYSRAFFPPQKSLDPRPCYT